MLQNDCSSLIFNGIVDSEIKNLHISDLAVTFGLATIVAFNAQRA